ncbi:MAG TPA: S9 family peptidase [Longimicrobium sp.]|nr:S9 family peptidase [Longimicrobium sp.]
MRRSIAALAATLLLPLGALAQEPTLTPGDNLVVQGIPPIPASLAAEVRRYTESRAAPFLDWHPTRREMLVATRFANAAQIHRVAMPGGARTQLTFSEEPITSAVYEPRGEGSFLFLRDEGGNEFDQIYRYDAATGRITLLTDGGRSQNDQPVWNRAGTRIAWGSTARNGADRDVWVMDPSDPSSRRLVMEASGGGWFVSDWSPDDRTLLVLEYESVNRSHLWLVDAASGQKRPLTQRGADSVAYGGAEFSTDGRGVYLTTDLGAEFQRLSYMDLSTRAITPLTADIPWDVVAVEVSPDGGTVAFVTNEEGASRLYLLDTRTRAYRRVESVPVGVIGRLRWHPSGREVGFSLNSARSPTDAYSVDVASGALARWTESELGGLVASDLVEPQIVRWPTFDGRTISGFLYRPPARFTGRRPVIINIHGGPEGQSRPIYLGRSNYYLNELGVAILFPNVRGSTGFGKSFVKLDNGMKREESVQDIGALLDWIATQPDLDPSRVMVTGGSYGGYMTLAVATNYADRICCALDVVGISHFGTFLRNTESYRRDLRRAEYGDERDPAMAAFFERISPLNNAARITKPLFVVQGGNDPRVPRTEAEQIVARVQQGGTPVWYLMARDEGHGFAKKANQDFQFYATVMFVRQNLLGQ